MRSSFDDVELALSSWAKRLDDDELLGDADALVGIPPGEFVDESDELALNGMPNAGTGTPDGGADVSPSGGGDPRLGIESVLAISAAPPAWPGGPSIAPMPLPDGEPAGPCKRPGKAPVMVDPACVGGLPPFCAVSPGAEPPSCPSGPEPNGGADPVRGPAPKPAPAWPLPPDDRGWP